MRNPFSFIFTGVVFSIIGYAVGIALERVIWSGTPPTPLSMLPKRIGRRNCAFVQLAINIVVLYVFELLAPSWAVALTLTEGMLFPAVLFGVQARMFEAMADTAGRDGTGPLLGRAASDKLA
eukprot:tig00000142_g8649.t1